MANICTNKLIIRRVNNSKEATKQFQEFITKSKKEGEIILLKDAQSFKEQFMDENFEMFYRNDADMFVEHSEMKINNFMVGVGTFKMVKKEGTVISFVRNDAVFTMEGLLPCPEELKHVTCPVRAENGETQTEFKARVERHKKLYGAEDWYKWNCTNRGTKWDVFESHIINETKDEIIYGYDTAWSHNGQFLYTVAPQFPLLNIKLEYELEEGVEGYIEYEEGELMGEDQWDMERNEEDEDY